MSDMIDRFPNIKFIAREIAYDNGIINRYMPEDVWMTSLDEVLGAEGVTEADLRTLEGYCATLSTEEKEILAAGEQTEMEAIQNRFDRPELFGLFEDIFNHTPEIRE